MLFRHAEYDRQLDGRKKGEGEEEEERRAYIPACYICQASVLFEILFSGVCSIFPTFFAHGTFRTRGLRVFFFFFCEIGVLLTALGREKLSCVLISGEGLNMARRRFREVIKWAGRFFALEMGLGTQIYK